MTEFSQATNRRNFPLLVEGQRLWVNRDFLAIHSTVFEEIFFGEDFDDWMEEYQLEGKKHDDVNEFLRILFPPSAKTIPRDKIGAVLSLAEEFKTADAKQRALNAIKAAARNVAELGLDGIVELLLLCQKHKLEAELELLIAKAAGYPLLELKDRKLQLNWELQAKIFEQKLIQEEAGRVRGGGFGRPTENSGSLARYRDLCRGGSFGGGVCADPFAPPGGFGDKSPRGGASGLSSGFGGGFGDQSQKGGGFRGGRDGVAKRGRAGGRSGNN